MSPVGAALKSSCAARMHGHLTCTVADLSAAAPMPRSSYLHPACTHSCGRGLLCGHDCRLACHGGTTCPPCSQPCQAACNHGRCQSRCTAPCQPCAEPCAWHCQHQVWAWLSHASLCLMVWRSFSAAVTLTSCLLPCRPFVHVDWVCKKTKTYTAMSFAVLVLVPDHMIVLTQ